MSERYKETANWRALAPSMINHPDLEVRELMLAADDALQVLADNICGTGPWADKLPRFCPDGIGKIADQLQLRLIRCYQASMKEAD
ncbi:hypothetical protein LCGC14_2386160 [marine sediment metagenome]|uniref:Uncharacterized protein n=1 Tax=marine sediment metagenome TaxID=412755 RepID=A0A0F9CLP2_9ZZZZ